MKKIAIILFISFLLVSCSNKNKDNNNAIKELQEQKNSLEKKNNELQEKNDSLEKENKELKEKIKNSENETLKSESIAKINKYLQEFNDSNKHFAKATFDEKNNTVNIELVEQAASDVSGLIDYNDKGLMTKPMLEGWQNEIVDTALLISKNLDKSITVKILQPTDKTKTIVEVKAGKVLKDVVK